MDISVIWAAVGAVGAVGAAGVAAWAAHQSRLSAGEANAAARALVAIERDRRHDEMTPELEITCTLRESTADAGDLRVKLTGGRLEQLADVTVTILDDDGEDYWAQGLHGMTHEQAQLFVWGPLEFDNSASEDVVSNRESRPRSLDRKSGENWLQLPLTQTQPGSWMSDTAEQWVRRWRGKPVRVLVTCRHNGYEPWLIQEDVRVWKAGQPLI